MLKKLLKYDLKYIFRYWWIAAAASLVASVLGGICLSMLDSGRALPAPVYTMCIIIIVLAVIGFFAFAIFGSVICFIRFYKNLFSDEGYLTFTLPVTMNDILGSKLIAGVIAAVSSLAMIFVDVFLMLWVCWGEEVPEILGDFIEEFFEELGFYFPVYCLELLGIGVACVAFSVLLTYICITLSCTMAKKARVVIAIGIYYVANNAISLVVNLLTSFGTNAFSQWLVNVPAWQINSTVSLALLAIFLVCVIFSTVLYIIQHKLLQSKLNLS